MKTLFNIIFSVNFGYAILRVTTPILFATLAALISDKAGVINIGLEGIMLSSALAGVIVSAATQSAWIGLLGALIVGTLIGVLLAYFSLDLKADTILSGIAINLMASGGTVFVLYLVAHDKGISTSLKSMVLPKVTLPLIDKIPVIGGILSGHNVLTYISLLSVILMYILLFKTPLGLKIRSVGENPDAASSVGINVKKVKYLALAISGMLAGFGGAYMSMGYVSWFSQNMTAGRGFIALAAEAMGSSSPLTSFLAALIFGIADALSNSIQSLRLPPEFVQSIPYIATIIGLIVNSAKADSKKAKVEEEK